MNIKRINKINFGLLLITFMVSCSLIPENKAFDKNLDTDPAIQAKYHREWLENTKDITDINRYTGNSKLFGVGALNIELLFKDAGDLWNSTLDFGSDAHLFYKLLYNENKSQYPYSFIDGKTALMVYPIYGNSDLGEGALHIIRVSNNTIYRGSNPKIGLGALKNWDKKTFPSIADDKWELLADKP